MKIFQNLVKLIVFSIFVLPVLLYAVSENVTEKVPHKTVDLPNSVVKTSPYFPVTNEFRILTVVPDDPVIEGSEWGGGTGGTAWIREGLSIYGLQMIEEVGSFQGFVGGTARKKSTGAGNEEPKKWDFSLVGNYNIKCTNGEKTGNGYINREVEGLINIANEYILNQTALTVSTAVNGKTTVQDLINALNDMSQNTIIEGEIRVGYGHCRTSKAILKLIEYKDSVISCSVCNKNKYLVKQVTFIPTIEKPIIFIPSWKNLSETTSFIKEVWNQMITHDIFNHESGHLEDYKNIFLSALKSYRYQIHGCLYCDPDFNKKFQDKLDAAIPGIKVDIQATWEALYDDYYATSYDRLDEGSEYPIKILEPYKDSTL